MTCWIQSETTRNDAAPTSLTIKDLEKAQDVSQDVFQVINDIGQEVELAQRRAKEHAADVKRIKWEAAHPEQAKERARGQAQADAMEDDMVEAKAEARRNGESWGDVKEEWIAGFRKTVARGRSATSRRG